MTRERRFPRVRHRVRRVLRRVARLRGTRAWPVLRPFYRLVRRVVDVDRLVGRAGSLTLWTAQDRVHRARRRLRTLGFTEPALRELANFAEDPSDPVRQRLAAWELALWHADRHEPGSAHEALGWLERAADGEVDPVRLRQIAVVTADCQAATGRHAEAERTVTRALTLGPAWDVLLAHANLARTGSERLARINRALDRCGVSPVSSDRSPGPPTLDTLVVAAAPAPPADDLPRVSVLVPAYQAEPTVGTALRSLLTQTWPALEILVVDDASTDGTAAAVRELARRDPRVRLLRTDANRGPYVARNVALDEATGEFVTCHDADDWSHPQKIERQVRHLLRHPQVVGNTSQQARVSADLRFHRRGQPGRYVFRNLSSFLFRRGPVRERVGYWDSVRFGADEELVQRVVLAFGADAVADLDTGPLCLQRQAPGSLTTDPRFGYHGFLMGARQDYLESYQHHHRTATTLRYGFPQHPRPFPVAAPLRTTPASGTGRRRHFDVVIASDFRLLGGSTQSSIEEIKAQRALGLRTGLVPLARYGVDPVRTVLPSVRDLVDGDLVQVLVSGEEASCDLLVVRYPPVLHYRQRYVPRVHPEQVRVIVNQPPMSDYGPDAVRRYDLAHCAENLRDYVGRDAVWHPIGPQVRRALHEHHATELSTVTLSDQDWLNIIDVSAWARSSRPEPGGPVRVGRHSRDHPVKWPATAADLTAAYPDHPAYEVRVLGGAGTPEELLGRRPRNWRVWRFGEIPPMDFLATLDAFVYYTHPDWVESFGRAVLEAMAVGVPAVLPHSYQDLFGDAALYAKPSEVLATVDRLTGDEGFYDARVRGAWAFVERRFGYPMHARRLGVLLGRDLGGDG